MTRRLELERSFRKRAHKLLTKNLSLEKTYLSLLAKLANDPFDPTLHTHALSGDLKGKYACSLTHDLRVVFRLYNDIVHLLDIGSHDEVY